jgi:Zinc finger, C3HC4 type (RING finger)
VLGHARHYFLKLGMQNGGSSDSLSRSNSTSTRGGSSPRGTSLEALNRPLYDNWIVDTNRSHLQHFIWNSLDNPDYVKILPLSSRKRKLDVHENGIETKGPVEIKSEPVSDTDRGRSQDETVKPPIERKDIEHVPPLDGQDGDEGTKNTMKIEGNTQSGGEETDRSIEKEFDDLDLLVYGAYQQHLEMMHLDEDSIHSTMYPVRPVLPEVMMLDSGVEQVCFLEYPNAHEMFIDELKCPICLDVIEKTYTVDSCLHRFCGECLHRSLRTDLGPKEHHECPSCRAKMPSKRSSKADPLYDVVVSRLQRGGGAGPYLSGSSSSATGAAAAPAGHVPAPAARTTSSAALTLAAYRKAHAQNIAKFREKQKEVKETMIREARLKRQISTSSLGGGTSGGYSSHASSSSSSGSGSSGSVASSSLGMTGGPGTQIGASDESAGVEYSNAPLVSCNIQPWPPEV